MTVEEFERAVFELEDIRLVVRAPRSAHVGDYDYERRAAGNASVTEWLDQRIRPLVGTYDVAVLNGDGATPNGRTKLETLRATYAR